MIGLLGLPVAVLSAIPVAPPALHGLLLPTPAIIHTVEGGLWGTLDREMARLGLRRDVRRAIAAELRRLAGSREVRDSLADLSRWSGVKLAMLPGFAPLMIGGGNPSYLGSAYNNGSDVSTCTFTGLNFGEPGATRYILVGTTGSRSSSSTPSMTIGGIGGTAVGTLRVASQTQNGFFIANVPTGSTGTVVVSWSGGTYGCFVMLWRIPNLTSVAPTAQITTAGTTLTGTITVPGDGWAYGIADEYNAGGVAAWSGLVADENDIVGGGTHCSAARIAGAQTSLTVNPHFSATESHDSLNVVALH